MSTFADLVKQIGGEYVDVSYIASPRFNPHFIEAKPSDVVKVKRADLFVHAGLDLEAWRWPLVDATGNAEVCPGGSKELDLSKGIELLEVPTTSLTRAAGDIHLYGNPHYWIHPENTKKMAETICNKLCALDPQHENIFHQNLEIFSNRLNPKISEWKTQVKPYEGQEFIAYHNAWVYLMSFLGFKIELFLEPKPGIPPTPKQVELVENRIKEKGIKGIIHSDYYPSNAADAVAKATGAKVIILCQNVGELPEAKDTISMIDYNVRQLMTALQQNGETKS
ncbi:MAG: zinc ABC transporter substrate-binding protein [Chlamydiae bacterium]|nr:zinc ABC transporter substrate-binding protein [Chlamydiota bacterium]MBI3266963.1 zinc ABC transporter substrate-binding protein [Chlamydiota bacterium]